MSEEEKKTNENGDSPSKSPNKDGGVGKRKKKLGEVQHFGPALEPYADDQTLYKSRITDADRKRVFEHLVQHKVRRQVPDNFEGFIKENEVHPEVNELSNYSKNYQTLLKLIVSKNWDYIYLSFLLIWLLGFAYLQDPWIHITTTVTILEDDTISTDDDVTDDDVTDDVPTINTITTTTGTLGDVSLLNTLLMLMPVTQIVTILGSIYMCIFCNDLTLQMAKLTFPSWSWGAVISCQAIEFFLFGGKNRKGLSVRKKEMKSFREMFGFGPPKVHDVEEEEQDIEHGHDQVEEYDFYGEGTYAGDYEQEDMGDFDDGTIESGQMFQGGFDDGGFVHDGEHGSPPLSSEDALHHEDGVHGGAPRAEKPEDDHNLDMFTRMKMEEEAAALEERRKEAIRIAREERKIKNWLEWKCVVCNRKNRRPEFPKTTYAIGYGEVGEFYKRNYVMFIKNRDVPQCTKCFAYADYKPPLGSSHLFPFEKGRYEAFKNYPKKVVVQSGLRPTTNVILYNKIKSFFFGIQSNTASLLLYNDWRLRVWANNQLPENPRPIKPKNELFQVGEVVECKLQKSSLSRARITRAHSNHSYDITYDSGEELRYVLERHLRLPPEKGASAYVVEVILLFFIILQPVFLYAAVSSETPGIFGTGFLLIGLVLFVYKIGMFVIRLGQQIEAGCCQIFKIHFFFMLPFLLMIIAGLSALTGAYMQAAVYFIILCLYSTMLLMMMKATFGGMGMIIFFQASIAAYLAAMWCEADGDETQLWHPSFLIHMAPSITSGITLIVFRFAIEYIWHVHLTIRPLFNFDPLNDTCSGQLKLCYHKYIKGMKEDDDNSDEESDEESEAHDPFADLDLGDLGDVTDDEEEGEGKDGDRGFKTQMESPGKSPAKIKSDDQTGSPFSKASLESGTDEGSDEESDEGTAEDSERGEDDSEDDSD